MLFDDIYHEIGDFGLYQIVVYLLLQTISVTVGWSHVSIVFLGAWMDHWCEVPGLANLTNSQVKNIAIPQDADGKYSHCAYYDLPYDEYSREELSSWNRTIRITDDTPQQHCSGWTYDTSVFQSTMMSEWDLVCDTEYLIAVSQTVYMFGLLAGSFFYGQLSDAFGRKKAVVASLVVWIGSGLGASFCSSLYGFFFLRFLVGGSAMGAFSVAFVMCMELIGPKWRLETSMMFQSFFAIGVCTLSGISYAWPYFQTTMIILTATPIISLIVMLFVPESPRWLVSKGRDEEAEAIIRLAGRINRRPAPEHLKLEDNRIGISDDMEKATVLDLFKTPRLRKFTICMWISWMIVTIVYYGLSLGVGLLEGNIFFNNFLVGIVEIPSYFIALVALKKIGRKYPLIATYAGSAVFCLVAMPFMGLSNFKALLISLLMIGKGFGSVSFAILYVYSAELFPTVARNVGIGTSSMAGRIGGLVQPQIQLMDKLWAPAPFLVYGAVSIVGCLISLVFPETRNKKLPETIEEAENFGLEDLSKIQGVEKNLLNGNDNFAKAAHLNEKEMEPLKAYQ